MPQWDTKSWSYCREFFGVFSIGIARRGIQGQIMKCTNQSQKINYLSVKPLTYPVKRKRIRGWQLYSCRVPEVLCAELRRYTESCVQDLGLFCFVSPVGWADTRGSGGVGRLIYSQLCLQTCCSQKKWQWYNVKASESQIQVVITSQVFGSKGLKLTALLILTVDLFDWWS